MLTLDKVYKASHLLKQAARRTDMIESSGLIEGCDFRLKAENLQLTGSFKLRGAFFKIASLPRDNREIVACGYSTQLGVTHHNTFNHFNLSCDLIEPFRILIDRWVDSCGFLQFGTKEKHRMLEIFNQSFFIDGTQRRLDDCIMMYVRSIFKAISFRELSAVKFCSWQKQELLPKRQCRCEK